MTTQTTAQSTTSTPLDPAPMSVRGKLAAAWGSLIFLILYIDYFHLYQPGEIDSIRNGVIFEFEISGALMSVFFVIIALPGLMVLLSATLPARANRITNLVFTSIYIPLIIFNIAGTTADYVFYYVLTIGVELAIMAYILRTAATWPRTAAVTK
ncbi:MAG: hypothetical protein B7Y93_01790 [Micrococcales bacterium 32-70-13]|nr:MAG: hypothetical protein B7Y93_01790 [Micrococcales bacterium 32-70-13]